MSLCILLKRSYMVCGSISCVSSKLFAHLMPFQQASSHFCNQNTLNIQNWLSFILRVRVRSKYFAKINFERNISLFQNNKERKKRHVSLKDEMWSQNKMQNEKTRNKKDRQFNTLLGSAFLAISVFCQAFQSLVILRMLRWHYGRWCHFSQTQLDSWNSCNRSTEWHKIPQWYSNLFSRLYHLENDGCMGFGVRAISPESNRCW